MEHPYRRAPYESCRPRRRRRRATHLAVGVGVLWLLGVSRVVIAVDRDEPFGPEPAMAALLSVVPPIALFFQSSRASLVEELHDDDAAQDGPPPFAS